MAQRIRVPSERHGVPDRLLKACRFERADDRRRHRALARDVEPVGRSDVLDAPIEAVAVPRRDFASHRFRAFAAQGAPDRFGYGPSPFDSLGMVVRGLRDAVACCERFLERSSSVRKDAAAGVDGLTAAQYEDDLEANPSGSLEPFKSGRYRVPAVRRVHVGKPGTSKIRPVGIPTPEDWRTKSPTARC